MFKPPVHAFKWRLVKDRSVKEYALSDSTLRIPRKLSLNTVLHKRQVGVPPNNHSIQSGSPQSSCLPFHHPLIRCRNR
jgi:hypothetical protein